MPNFIDLVIRGTDKSKQALNTPIKNIKSLKVAVKQLGPAFKLGALAGVSAMALLGKQAIETASSAKLTADRLGLTTEALTEFRFASKQTGVDTATTDMALQRFTRRVAEAGAGFGEAKGAMAEMGIQLKDNQGVMRPTSDLLRDVSDRLSKVTSQGDRVRLAMKLFDSEGVKLVNTLQGGTEQLDKFAEEARKAGVVIGDEAGANALAFTDTMTLMTQRIQGTALEITSALLPGINKMMEGFEDSAEGPSSMTSALNGVVEALKFVGKIALSITQGIVTAFDLAGQGIATVLLSLTELMSGNIQASKDALSSGMDDIIAKSAEASETLETIWTEKQTTPPVPDVKKHEDAQADILAVNRKAIADQKKLDDIAVKNAKAKEKKIVDDKKKAEKDKLALQTAMSGAIDSLVGNSFALASALAGDNANAQKAIAISQAIVQGGLAIIKTMASVPYPANFVASASVAVGVGAQIAKITSAPTFAEGGMLGGGQPQGDKTSFLGNAGEIILNRSQQDNTLEQMEGGGVAGKMMRVMVMIGNTAIIDTVAQASKSGELTIDARAVR